MIRKNGYGSNEEAFLKVRRSSSSGPIERISDNLEMCSSIPILLFGASVSISNLSSGMDDNNDATFSFDLLRILGDMEK